MKDMAFEDIDVFSIPLAPNAKALRAYGDILFLASHSPRYRDMTAAELRAAMDPPIDLRQMRIWREDGVPRGLFTWARLSDDAAIRFIRGEDLTAEDLTSGETLWITEMIAAFPGAVREMAQFIMTPGNLTEEGFYYRKLDASGAASRVVEVNFRTRNLAKVVHADAWAA